jgi:hypothetical protein
LVILQTVHRAGAECPVVTGLPLCDVGTAALTLSFQEKVGRRRQGGVVARDNLLFKITADTSIDLSGQSAVVPLRSGFGQVVGERL